MSLALVVPTHVTQACHALFAAGVDYLDRAVDQNEEFFPRDKALEQLRGILAELWSKRIEREEAFAEIVNMLQAVFVQRRVEDFSAEQLGTLRIVFAKLCDTTSFDDDFANTLTFELMNGGIDAFREFE